MQSACTFINSTTSKIIEFVVIIFLYNAVRLYFDEDNIQAFPTFVYSIYYIFLIFAALLIDHFII